MFDLPSSTTTCSAAGVEMFPYCLAAPAAAPPETRIASCGTVTLARSSSVILSAGLSSVFAIGSLSGACGRLLLRLRSRLLLLDRSPFVERGRTHHALKSGLAGVQLGIAESQQVFFLGKS